MIRSPEGDRSLPAGEGVPGEETERPDEVAPVSVQVDPGRGPGPPDGT